MNDWISLKDKLPEIDQEVLSYCENQYVGPNATYPLGHKYFALDKYLKVGFRTDMLGYGKVLFWQTLPEPPN